MDDLAPSKNEFTLILLIVLKVFLIYTKNIFYCLNIILFIECDFCRQNLMSHLLSLWSFRCCRHKMTEGGTLELGLLTQLFLQHDCLNLLLTHCIYAEIMPPIKKCFV